MEEIAHGNSAVWRSNRAPRGPSDAKARTRRTKAKGLALPRFRTPQLATLVEDAPGGEDWLHELKYDGYRVLVAANDTEVRCYTRSGQDWTPKFRSVADAFRTMQLASTLIDGEMVAFNAEGRSDFSTLQQTLGNGGRLDYFAFDLLVEGGEDISKRPLIELKNRLQALLDDLPKGSAIHYSTHIQGKGGEVLDSVCDAGQEGIISKRASSTYRGDRSSAWLKVKCKKNQEFVIGGWTPSDKRRGFKSLIVGTWEDGKLIYKGRVGTGFNDRTLDELSVRFEKIARKDSPFEAIPRELRRSKWVEPKLVAQIEFGEFTSDGILRHPSFQGLREDKKAKDVHVEKPMPVAKAAGDEGADTERAGVRISSPNKVLFPKQGLTKADIVGYYEAVAPLMLPHVGRRPLSLVRCPQGFGHHCFYQKHDSGGFPEEMRRVMIAESDGTKEQYFYITDLKGLVAGVQMGTLEFHIWGSSIDQLEKPDRIVIDLDPDVGLGFEDVRRAAFDLRDRLAHIGLKTFPMLSGGKGFHLVAPLTRRAHWKEVKSFCHGFAVMLGGDAPERYVANMSKAKRKGRIFVDYLRNERGSTAIAPYSTRTRETAAVAAPITWKEAETVAAANVFTVKTMPERAKKVGDPWKGYFKVKQSITKAMMKAVGADA
jgi:bifunctional non-homologous end joining protein LigD